MQIDALMELIGNVYFYGAVITLVLMTIITRPTLSIRELMMLIIMAATWPIVVPVALNSTFHNFYTEMDERYNEKKQKPDGK